MIYEFKIIFFKVFKPFNFIIIIDSRLEHLQITKTTYSTF